MQLFSVGKGLPVSDDCGTEWGYTYMAAKKDLLLYILYNFPSSRLRLHTPDYWCRRLVWRSFAWAYGGFKGHALAYRPLPNEMSEPPDVFSRLKERQQARLLALEQKKAEKKENSRIEESADYFTQQLQSRKSGMEVYFGI